MNAEIERLIDKLNSLSYDANFRYKGVNMQGFCRLMTDAFSIIELIEIKEFLNEYLNGAEDGDTVSG